MSEVQEFVEFDDIEDISQNTAELRIQFAEHLRTLAADIIAGRAFAAVYAAYERDDPHTLICHGIFGGISEVIHMQSDLDVYFANMGAEISELERCESEDESE